MKRYTILVTAVGAIVGYGIIESLQHSGYDLHIIGCDIFSDAVGRYFADDFVVSTPAADEGYVRFLSNLIDEKHIDMVLFGIEQEITAVHKQYEALDGYHSKLIINKRDIIDICDDKYLTYLWLKDNHLKEYAIESILTGEFSDIRERFGERFLVKPRISRGGKGIAEISLEDDFDYYRRKLGNNFMVQPIVGDTEHEYTVGVFGLGDGSYSGDIYLRRTLSQEGATAKAWVVEDEELKIAAERITEQLKPEGPTNYQFRKAGSDVFLLEINPRISSSVSIRSKFGYNEAKMCIEYYLEGRIPEKVTVNKGHAVRYIKDLVFES